MYSLVKLRRRAFGATSMLLISVGFAVVISVVLPSCPPLNYGVRVSHVTLSQGAGGIMLPSETSLEPYRTSEHGEAAVKNAMALGAAVGAAERVVIYGLALSALGIELSTVLAPGLLGGKTREVIIIDPECPAVERKLLLVSAGAEVDIVKVDPTGKWSGTR